ncbi:DUF5659 domain-containing protein [Bacillus sp. J37]|uniref:DUF5659 domain-containing protein n=1 Tax=Bacillus sp. J37 TaxID=935837 RepID=UPI00047C9F07|nr:DUF5659 domain-containing protein [Bacillus sp. J37]
MKNVNEKDFVVFKQALAGFLMMNSCRLKKITPSKKDPSKFVYFFNDNETVRSLVDQYSNQ